jgi:hypothetical protein
MADMFNPNEELDTMNRSRHFVLASACVLISLGPRAFSQPASPGPTPKAAGEIDNRPIQLALDVTKPGRTFAGIGGNFRLQNPTSDPPVIQYNLENLRVAWGRVAMPWNVKQLGSTPAGSFYLPMACDGSAVACAAFGDIANGVYAVHLVNNGATRPATLTGLPANLKELRVYVTDSRRGMKEGDRIPVAEGTAQLTLDTASYTTLIGGR